jgi:membrane associated rhomboid family serine protease
METETPQRSPLPGTTWLRIGARTWTMPDAVWEHWVRRGHVPTDALVLSETWTRGVWKRAGNLEVYYLFAPAPAASASAALAGAPDAPDAPPSSRRAEADRALAREGLPAALWGRGISTTQALLFANLVISAALVWSWKNDYSDRLWTFSQQLRSRLESGWVVALLPPLFLHASAQHLLGNMIGLTAGGAAVEEFYGRGRTFALYLLCGIGGAILSLLRSKEVLSVGASGAIMGLYGVILVFLLRYRSRFTERQKTKTTRIYLPLLVLALLPGIFQADLLSHVGGFVAGVLLALLVSPLPQRIAWARDDESPAQPPEERGTGAVPPGATSSGEAP